MNSIHPIVYKCNDFSYFMEEWRGLNIIHIEIRKFTHTTFKKMLKALYKIQNSYKTNLYGYGLEESTYKLMKMAGFKETQLLIETDNHLKRRMLCLPQQR